MLFQSTPPARGATILYGCSAYFSWHFNPRPPRGGRPENSGDNLAKRSISIHAPREGGDYYRNRAPVIILYFNPRPPRGGRLLVIGISKRAVLYFNPRPPRGGRPGYQYEDLRLTVISIHAPREGGDVYLWPLCLPASAFQSTPPARGATQYSADDVVANFISIHAPREGGDYVFAPGLPSLYDFNPRPPRGGRLSQAVLSVYHTHISIHAPREGGD